MDTKIEKASGRQELFSKAKIIESSMRAGASEKLAEHAAKEVKENIQDKKVVHSDDVYNEVISCLIEKDPRVAAKYSLKRAIMRMGPAGYIFEKYIAAVLKEHGFNTQVGQIVQGKCVKHEVDVLAKKEDKHIIAEAKYHNRRGIHTGVQVAMYTYARFKDVEAKMKEVEKNKEIAYEGWLVTNTKCSNDARKYAECKGLKIVSWRYPKQKGLEYYIESKGLYPTTTLPSLKKKNLEALSKNGILFLKDLLKYTPEELQKIAFIPPNKSQQMHKEIKGICL